MKIPEDHGVQTNTHFGRCLNLNTNRPPHIHVHFCLLTAVMVAWVLQAPQGSIRLCVHSWSECRGQVGRTSRREDRALSATRVSAWPQRGLQETVYHHTQEP